MKLRELIQARDAGTAMQATKAYTVGDAVKDWLDYGLGDVGPSTANKYRSLASRHITPLLDKRKLKDSSTTFRCIRSRAIARRIPHEEIAFYDLGCTIGAYTLFPSMVRVDGRWRLSVNGCRGMHPRIRDRFDLTLECIRRHYADEDSPLTECLAVHRHFFALFQNFAGYVSYFLLNDLVTDGVSAVRFLTPFGGFTSDPLPVGGVDEYRMYMQRSMEFVGAHNERIARYAATLLAKS